MPTSRTETSSLLGLDDLASTLSHHTRPSSNVSHARAGTIGVSEHRPEKRRKTAGLNTRFDRMIKSVDTMLWYRGNSAASSRKRMQSSSTSSVSSHDVPKTPLDAYSGLHLGKVGKDFTLLKMKKSPPPFRKATDVGRPELVAPPKEPKNQLPDWLANTFCSLPEGHPLRGLLSPSHIITESKSNSPVAQLLCDSHEEGVFAFSPFESDKQEVPDIAYRPSRSLNAQRIVSSIDPTEIAPSHFQPGPTTSEVLPFSTPGRFAPVRRPTESPTAGDKFQKPSALVPQQVTSHAANMMRPPALPASHLRVDNEIGLPHFTREFSGITQDNEPPSDLQKHGACIPSHEYRPLRGGDYSFNVYATPGPTLTSSLPVYFDSPTEDPSLSDPLHPESCELDLDNIDFRWRPYLRSNTKENKANGHATPSSSLLRYAVPNHVDDRTRLDARSTVDQGAHGASSEEPSSPTEDVKIAYLDGISTIRPNNMNTSTINNLIRPWSLPINDVHLVRAYVPSHPYTGYILISVPKSAQSCFAGCGRHTTSW